MRDDDYLDENEESLIDDLLATPVGRRWLLKAGLASAVGLTAAGKLATASRATPARRSRPPTETLDLQLALGHLTGVSQLRLVANGAELELSRHTAGSRQRLQEQGGIWARANLAVLTHHVDGLELPTGRAMVLAVRGRRAGRDVTVAHHLYVPAWATLRLARLARRRSGSLESLQGSLERLAGLGLDPSDIRSPQHIVQLGSYSDTVSTAATLVGLHPSTATVNATAAGIAGPLLQATPAVVALGSVIAASRHPYGLNPTALDADGKTPSQIQLGDQLTTFKTFRFNTADPNLRPALQAAVKAGVQVVRDSPDLGTVIDQPLDQRPDAATKIWVQSQGIPPQTTAYVAPSQVGDPGLQIRVKNGGDLYGTKTVVTGGLSNGQVPLKLYNNWVRWASVYVQYLGANDANLSYDANATFPNTANAQSLGLLPQIFTVLGVPIWDTNTIDVTLDFPEEAHTARLLFCGLGSDLNQGDWQQYFKPGHYSSQAIAPQDEVLFAALITGIFTIGLTAFALATDGDIGAAWDGVRNHFGLSATTYLELKSTLQLVLPAIEALALGVAAGAETYEDISANHGSTTNIWSILLQLASVIPKVLFNPAASGFWRSIALTVLGVFALEKVLNAIPTIGEVIALIEVAGDEATLAEVGTETIIAPWVIENQINLVYPATLTISRDTRASTWPSTAVSWQLQATIDGAAVLSPITGTINENEHIRSDPLELHVDAPFGGKLITWSFTLEDASGTQVGTGSAGPFPNNDPANPTSTVDFAITQLDVPIKAGTTFQRTDTTAYSGAAGGYTWSGQVPSTGTLTHSGVQQVTGATISTKLGVAGVVFEQGDRYYVRGVPIAENGDTIQLGTGTVEGFSRRPFLLFDPFVEEASAANHVLLEPDATTDGYHVRRVAVDSTSGAVTWDPSLSSGYFPLAISAAALHTSGWIVAVNTANGRLARVRPLDTALPPIAAHSAGPGTQVGLLSSPVAIAITHDGVVLILEGAAFRIAAFDLNGNPVAYFEASASSRRSFIQGPFADAPDPYRLPLDDTLTYLDLAVDGAGQMYVLSYSGDGAAPSDYRVDVLTPSGQPVTTTTGVNVPRFAVDYWRSLFTGNFDALADSASGQPRIDPALGVAEPSVSRFDPFNPTGTGGALRRTFGLRRRA